MRSLEISMVRIGIIIPTVGRFPDLHRCLTALEESAALLPSRTAEINVIIAADGCEIEPRALPGRLPVRTIPLATRVGAQTARQIACHETEADIFGFLDDDAIPRGDWLRVILSRLSDGAAAITGRVLPMDTRLLSRARQARYDQRYAPLHDSEPVGFFAGGNSAIRADLFHASGGFSIRGTGGDNSICDSLSRLGHCVRFAPDLVVVHRHDKGIRAAAAASASAGLAHPVRVSAASALRALAAPAPGSSFQVRMINRGLACINTLAKAMPRRIEGSSNALDD